MEKTMTTTLITTGNLTENARIMDDKQGRKYVLLRLASNEYQRDAKGEIVRDENNYPVSKKTTYYSIFVSEKAGALTASNLEKGQAIKVVGKANMKTFKNSDNHEINQIESIRAYSIDTDPYKKLSESETFVPEEEMDDIPFAA